MYLLKGETKDSLKKLILYNVKVNKLGSHFPPQKAGEALLPHPLSLHSPLPVAAIIYPVNATEAYNH